MNIKEFDSLITEFKSMADTAKSKLTIAIDLLSEGKMPGIVLRKEIDESLGDLQDKFRVICTEVTDHATYVDCPDINASIDLFADVYKRNEELRNKAEAAKSTVEKFLRVSSSSETYLTALKPYQDTARQILENITAAKAIDGTDNEIQKEKVFLQILETETDSEETDSLFDILEEHYPQKVTTGLARKRYFVEGGTADAGKESEPRPEPEKDKKETGGESKDIIQKTPNWITAEGRLKSIKPSVTALVKDINGNNARNAFQGSIANFSRNILHLAIRFSVISKNLVKQDMLAESRYKDKDLYDIDRSMTIVMGALSDLKKKGYLLEYVLPSQEEPVYCLSPLIASCLKKKTARDLFQGTDWSECLHFIGGERVAENILNKIYRSNVLLFEYISHDGSLWYEESALNWERFFKKLSTDDAETPEIIDCEVFDRINLHKDNEVVRCVLDNGNLPNDLPVDENILVYDRKFESVHSGNPVYYFDEMKAEKDAPPEHPEDAVNSGDSSKAKTLSSVAGMEASAVKTSKTGSIKKENTEAAESEKQTKPKPEPEAKKTLLETDSDELDKKVPEFIYAKSKLNRGKADAVQFVKDLTSKYSISVGSIIFRQLIIEYGFTYGVFSSDWLLQMITIPEDTENVRMGVAQDISLALTELVKKGYVVEYEVPSEGGSVYCISPLTETCLKKKAARGIEWNHEIPSKLLFVGEEKVDAETVGSILLNNRLYLSYMKYCENKRINFQGYFKRFLAKLKNRALKDPGLLIFDEVEICVNGKVIRCMIDNGNLLYCEPKNALVVDRQYDSSPSGTNVYYMDELADEKTRGGRNKDRAGKAEKTTEPGHDVADKVSNTQKPKRGEKKQAAPGQKEPEKAEQTALPSRPVEQKQTKTDTVATVQQSTETTEPAKQDSTPETNKRPEAEVIPEQPAAGHADTDNFEKLLDGKETPSDEVFYQIILSLLDGKKAAVFSNDSCVAQALLMAKATACNGNNTKCRMLYEQLLLATRLPLDNLRYTSEWLEETFSDDTKTLKSARLASYIQAMIRPDQAYDYSLWAKCRSILQNFENEFPAFTELKQLFNELITINETLPSGFSDPVLAHLGDATSKNRYVEYLQKSAKAFLPPPQGTEGIQASSGFYDCSMGSNSDISQALTVIAENKVKDLDVVKFVLNDYCSDYNGIFNIDQDKVEDKIDKFWSAATGKNHYPPNIPRSEVVNHFKERIQLMKNWSEYVDSITVLGRNIDEIKKTRKMIVKEATRAKKVLAGSADAERNLLTWVVDGILAFFREGNNKDIRTFSELLHTGVISLDDNGIPVIDEKWDQIRYYEPWRLILRHIVSLKSGEYSDLDKVKKNIFANSSPMYDNLQQLKLIGRFTGNDDDIRYVSNGKNINVARVLAEENFQKFRSKLELSYYKGRISEDEKETLLESAKQFKPVFYRNMDFGIWAQFLNVLNKHIEEASDARKTELWYQLQVRFDKFANNTDSTSYDKEPPKTLINARRYLEDEDNFAVTEEFISQFDNGITEAISEETDNSLDDPGWFEAFLDDRAFGSIYKECQKHRREILANFAISYCQQHYPEEWDYNQTSSGDSVIMNWPIRGTKPNEKKVADLFRAFGFRVESAVQNNNFRELVYELKVTPADKSKTYYPHTIARFGTQIKSPVNVVILFERMEAKQLTVTMNKLNLGELTIVLMDDCIDLGKRRQIAEEFHKTSGENSFIFIDWVLAIFLALHQKTDRLPILMECTLPFTSYQPFVCGGGSIADEMFSGRAAELRSLINLNGACVVYGGRQLGKTALLERTVSRCHKPQINEYAVYSNIIKCTSEKELVKTLSKDIAANTKLKIKTGSLEIFCNDIQKQFDTKKIKVMRLLMDEADAYLESIADKNYIALQPLIDLKRKTKNNFKFVLAGLHNVCRAKNATKNNGVFGQIGEPLCIKPLSPKDALLLLSRPLKCLGFKTDSYPHMDTILTQANYYPGILQFFGYKLVEEVTANYSNYYRAAYGNPPFELKDDMLGELIKSEDLNNSIKEKFRLSLDLDERYCMIARCIALLHYEQDEKKLNWMGYKADDIIKTAKYYEVHCLADLSRDGYILLMDEMVDMGILSRPESGYYRMRRSSFIQHIGRKYDDVFEEIVNNNRGTKE